MSSEAQHSTSSRPPASKRTKAVPPEDPQRLCHRRPRTGWHPPRTVSQKVQVVFQMAQLLVLWQLVEVDHGRRTSVLKCHCERGKKGKKLKLAQLVMETKLPHSDSASSHLNSATAMEQANVMTGPTRF
eukprot:1147028-Pelagomonas_calceolata.AAC.1